VEKLTLPSAFESRFFITERGRFAYDNAKFSLFPSLKTVLLPFFKIFKSLSFSCLPLFLAVLPPFYSVFLVEFSHESFFYPNNAHHAPSHTVTRTVNKLFIFQF